MITPYEIASIAVKMLDDKKARDIKLLRTTDVTVLADYFVICTAGSTTQLKSLCDELELSLKAVGEKPLRREGGRSGEWVLLDYACVVIHVFLQEAREFYTLERLWGDAEDIDINTIERIKT
jgi:ribosome-associated protein